MIRKTGEQDETNLHLLRHGHLDDAVARAAAFRSCDLRRNRGEKVGIS